MAGILAAAVIRVSPPASLGKNTGEGLAQAVFQHTQPVGGNCASFDILRGPLGPQPAVHRVHCWHGNLGVESSTGKLKSLEFQIDGLPVSTQKLFLWKMDVNRYSLEEKFDEVLIPGNSKPVTIITELTAAIETDHGEILVNNKYYVQNAASR